jgi:hypothetical protein
MKTFKGVSQERTGQIVNQDVKMTQGPANFNGNSRIGYNVESNSILDKTHDTPDTPLILKQVMRGVLTRHGSVQVPKLDRPWQLPQGALLRAVTDQTRSGMLSNSHQVLHHQIGTVKDNGVQPLQHIGRATIGSNPEGGIDVAIA